MFKKDWHILRYKLYCPGAPGNKGTIFPAPPGQYTFHVNLRVFRVHAAVRIQALETFNNDSGCRLAQDFKHMAAILQVVEQFEN